MIQPKFNVGDRVVNINDVRELYGSRWAKVPKNTLFEITRIVIDWQGLQYELRSVHDYASATAKEEDLIPKQEFINSLKKKMKRR